MKIIHVVAAYPPELGGMENAVKELAELTARKGHEVIVITSSFKKSKKIEKSNNLTVYRLWSIRIPGIPVTIPLLPFKLFKLIMRDAIVHVHYVLNFSMDIAILVARIRKAKIVAYIHIDPLPSGPLGFLNPPYKKLIWSRILSLPNRVIYPTEDYINSMRQKYCVPLDKCSVISYGIDISHFRRKASSIISPPVKILFVGRLHRQKNIARLLESFYLFQKRCEAILHIAGDGEDRKIIEEFIKHKDMSNVVLEGELRGTKLADLYEASDIFVLTSDFESFGIVNLEAMASGLPIVASDIPGVKSLLEGSAILVEPTPENFAEAMARLVENEQLRTDLVNKGFEKVTNYDWDTITEKMITLYRSL